MKELERLISVLDNLSKKIDEVMPKIEKLVNLMKGVEKA